jgi:DNA-binding phage protein
MSESVRWRVDARRKSGVERQHLYLTHSAKGNPELKRLKALLRAITVRPLCKRVA